MSKDYQKNKDKHLKNLKNQNLEALLAEASEEEEDEEEYFQSLYKSKGLPPTSKPKPVASQSMKPLTTTSVNSAQMKQPQELSMNPVAPVTQAQQKVTPQFTAAHLATISKDYQDQQLLYQNLSDEDEEEIKESRELLKGNGLKKNMSDEDEEDSDDIEDFLKNVIKGGNKGAEEEKDRKKKKAKNKKDTQAKPQKIEKINENVVRDVLEIIEKNEKLNEIGGAGADFMPLDQSSQLLSFDKKFYKLRNKLVDYKDYKDITKRLYEKKDHRFTGIVSSITVVQDYMFVGNSSGIIRVFDLKTEKEMKPLEDKSLAGENNRVTSLDISVDGGYLISGYRGGQVALWDLVSYKLIKMIPDLHQSDVINAKIYFMDDADSIYAVSSEDNGRVQLIKYNKQKYLGGYASEAQFLFKNRLQGTAAISIQRRNEMYPNSFSDNAQLVAFGALNEIVVCQMRPKIKEIFNIERPKFCKEKSIPYIDWGYGLTPSNRDQTVPIFAFAWDRLIQLFYVNETSMSIELDGFYYSEQEINSLHFIGDSILFALMDGQEVKILYTTKFYPGHFDFLSEKTDPEQITNFQKVQQVTNHAILEKDFELGSIKKNFIFGQNSGILNFNQSVKRYKHHIFFLGDSQVTRGKVFTWKEYLEHVKFKESADWSTVLKIVLEIYNGELKGFARVPDEKEKREGILGGYMKDIIKDSVQQALVKFKHPTNSRFATPQIQNEAAQTALQWDLIAIKSAIEFCLAINSTSLLFSDIFNLFAQSGLEEKFLKNLEPFILQGSFKRQYIPDEMLQRILNRYIQSGNLKILEKVITSLDLQEYSQKLQLIVTCEEHCLIGANLYLKSQSEEDRLGCKQILSTLLSLIHKRPAEAIDRDEVMQVMRVESSKKYDIEKSKGYLGYKLFWIIRLFLEGKGFPNGFLSAEKHRHHVYDIVNILCEVETLEEMIQIDSEVFFTIFAKLFTGAPLKYLSTQRDYYARNPQIKNKYVVKSPEEIITVLLLDRVKADPKRREFFYNRFIIAVQSYQNIELNPRINLSSAILIQAFHLVIKTLISKDSPDITEDVVLSPSQLTVSEEEMINAFKSFPFTQNDLEKMPVDNLISRTRLMNFRVFVLENRKDYVNSFRVNKMENELRKNIFAWIDKTLILLSQDHAMEETSIDLKNEIITSFKDLRQIDIEACQMTIDTWFDESLQDKLIFQELSEFPEEQFKYVKKLVLQNETKIQRVIEESLFDESIRIDAQRYLKYITLLVERLCEYELENVHLYVKNDYYPIKECLEICTKKGALMAQAVLHKRNGTFIEALTIYFSIITQECDPQSMLKEMTYVYRELDKTLLRTELDKKLSHFDFPLSEDFPHLYHFDHLLEDSLSIAVKNSELLGEQPWILILEFLQDYSVKIVERLVETAKRKILTSEDKNKIERVHHFVEYRKIMILRNHLPGNISLQRLTEKIELDYKEINTIYDNKVQEYKENVKYFKLTKKLQDKEVTIVSGKYFTEIKAGPKPTTHRTKCYGCGKILFQMGLESKKPIILFYCSHAYHMACCTNQQAGANQEEPPQPECTKCNRIGVDYVIQNGESNDKNKNKKTSKLNKNAKQVEIVQQSARQMANQLGNVAAAGNAPPVIDQSANNLLMMRRLEVFDQQLEVQGMYKNSFFN